MGRRYYVYSNESRMGVFSNCSGSAFSVYIFSYATPGYDFAEHPWGWRTVSLKKDGITVRYYTPKSAAVVDEKPIETEDGFIDETFVSNPLAK